MNNNNTPYKADGFTRREFIGKTAIPFAAAVLPLNLKQVSKPDIKAVVFDGLVIFDLKPVYALADTFFHEKSAELCMIWRTKQFEYTWIRTAAKQYIDFLKVTEDALVFAAKKTGVNLNYGQRSQLMNMFLELDIWPDVVPGLKLLKEKNLSLSLLSNFTNEMMNASMKHNQIHNYFDQILSTDQVGEFKPSPAAYQMGVTSLKLKKEEILFVAFGAWDAAGAKLFGYPTFWINRAHSPSEELGVVSDGFGYSLLDIVNFIDQ